MKNIILLLGALALSTLSQAQAVDSAENFGSLVPQKYNSLLSTRTAKQIGDLLTILIFEQSNATFSASTSATKSDSNQTGGSSPIASWLKLPVIGAILDQAKTAADSKMSGSGTTQQSGRFTAKISVMVKQVLPNGNLVIEGRRWITINKEEQNILITGVVRWDDIMPDNTINSENIANAEIRSEGTGVIAQRQRRGILTRILEWLF